MDYFGIFLLVRQQSCCRGIAVYVQGSYTILSWLKEPCTDYDQGLPELLTQLVKFIGISFDVILHQKKMSNSRSILKWSNYFSNEKNVFSIICWLFCGRIANQCLVTFDQYYLAELPSCMCSLLCKLIQVLKHHHFLPDQEVKELSVTNCNWIYYIKLFNYIVGMLIVP